MPRISEIHFNDTATGRFPAKEFVEIALSQEEYNAILNGGSEIHLALFQSDGRGTFDITIPVGDFTFDKDANEWVTVEYGTDHFNRTGSSNQANRWTVSASASPNDSPVGDTFKIVETAGVYIKNLSDGSVTGSDLVSPVSDSTPRAAPRFGPLAGKPVTIATISNMKPNHSLQFNRPKPDDQILANPTPGNTGVICYTTGTLIQTEKGPVAIEELVAGDRVLTLDMGYQKLRWIGLRLITADHLEATPNLRPIRIRANALGNGYPNRDLLVSPQHRMLINGKIPQRMFNADEVLVAAKHLLELDGVEIANDVTEVTYSQSTIN